MLAMQVYSTMLCQTVVGFICLGPKCSDLHLKVDTYLWGEFEFLGDLKSALQFYQQF